MPDTVNCCCLPRLPSREHNPNLICSFLSLMWFYFLGGVLLHLFFSICFYVCIFCIRPFTLDPTDPEINSLSHKLCSQAILSKPEPTRDPSLTPLKTAIVSNKPHTDIQAPPPPPPRKTPRRDWVGGVGVKGHGSGLLIPVLVRWFWILAYGFGS